MQVCERFIIFFNVSVSDEYVISKICIKSSEDWVYGMQYIRNLLQFIV